MTTVWVAFVLAFAVALVTTRVMIAVAWRFKILDRPDGYRKLHSGPIPRMGGTAIYLAFMAPLAALLVWSNLSKLTEEILARPRQLAGVMAGAALALGLGTVDDVFSLKPAWKLIWQVMIAAVMFSLGFTIDAVSNPFGPPLRFGVFALPVTVFWFVGCMNAVNLLDGLDGLAAGMTLFVCTTMFLVSLHFGSTLGMLLMASLGGAVLGFLVFNFPPARIFLGDSGSMLLGFLIAALSLVGGTRKAEAAVVLFVPVVALGLPILDTSAAILRRWYGRLPITAPDRRHIHHALVAMGYSQKRAVLILYSACLLLGLAALLITFARSETVLLVIGSLAVTAFVCIRVFSGVRMSDVVGKLTGDAERRQRQTRSRLLIERAMEEIRHAPDVDAVWQRCGEAFTGLGLDSALLAVPGTEPGAGFRQRRWSRASPCPDGTMDAWSVTLALPLTGDRGALQVEKRITRGGFEEGLPELLDRLRGELTAAIERLREGAPAPPGPTRTAGDAGLPGEAESG